MAAVSKHEGASFLILRDARTRVRSLPNVFDVRAPQDEAFETRARAFEVCRTSSACALLRMRTSIASFTAHDFKQPISFSRRVGVRGLRLLLRSPRIEGWAERRETFGCSAEHPWGVHITRHARRLARRLASHDAGRSPLRAPPWRFWAPGPRLPHRHLRRIGYSELLAPRSYCLEGGVPSLPGQTVTSRRRRTPRLAPHSGSLSRTRPQ